MSLKKIRTQRLHRKIRRVLEGILLFSAIRSKMNLKRFATLGAVDEALAIANR